MKEQIISLIMECDRTKEGVLSHPGMKSSCSIETIAEYLSKQLLNMGVLK